MSSSVQADATTASLPPPPSSSPSFRFLQASDYPRKKDGSLYSPEFQQTSLRPSDTNAVVVGRSAPSSIPNRPLPTPPSSEPSSSSDTEPSSSDDHLGSIPSLLAFFASERKIVKERDRERRRSAAVDKAARREARSRATLRYPKSHDLKIKDILARERRKKDEQEQEQEGEDGADEAADDEDGPVLRCGSIRLSFASMQISPSSSSHSSRSSRGTFIDGRSSSFDQGWPSTPPSPPRTSSTTTTPSPLSSSFTPIVSRRQRAAKRKPSLLPLPSSSVPTSPTTITLRLPSAKPNPRLLPFTLLDPSTPPPRSPTGPVTQLKHLADKLIEKFPEDKEGIEMQLKLEHSIANGEEPTNETRDDASLLKQVHVFVDHSNILVGLLQQPISPSPHHRQPHSHPHPTHHNLFPPPHHHHQHHSSSTLLPPKSTLSTSPPSPTTHFLNPAPTLSRHPQLQTLSHPSLALLLLRGREAKTRALVASSPLHQPLSDLQIPARGPWDVAVLRRVKEHELYEGMNPDATTTSGSDAEGGGGSAAMMKKAAARRKQHASSTARRPSFVGGGFKEQAVDELLQLKILQTILRHDSPSSSQPTTTNASSSSPTNTLILATGDCAGSPLNPGGFRECVEVALGKGWNVEVWGWRRGIGEGWREVERAWNGKGEKRMVVRELDEWEPFLRGGEGW